MTHFILNRRCDVVDTEDLKPLDFAGIEQVKTNERIHDTIALFCSQQWPENIAPKVANDNEHSASS